MKQKNLVLVLSFITLAMIISGCSIFPKEKVPNIDLPPSEDVAPLTKNLLFVNAASVETDTTGFSKGSSIPELDRDTSRSLHGDASLRLKGSAVNQGTWMASVFAPDKNGTYTASTYVYGSEGDQFFMVLQEKNISGGGLIESYTGDTFTLEGDGWERIHVTATLSNNDGNSVGIVVRNAQGKNFEIWLDQFQLEFGNEPTSWEMPIVTKNLLTYNQGTAEIDHRGFIGGPGQGTAPELSIDGNEAIQGNSSLKVDWAGDGTGETFYLWPTDVQDKSGTYTASVYIKGTPGDRYQLTLEEKGAPFTGVSSRIVGPEFELASNDWERHSVTIKMSGGHTLGLLVKHMNVESTVAWFDGFQLEQGAARTQWVSPASPY